MFHDIKEPDSHALFTKYETMNDTRQHSNIFTDLDFIKQCISICHEMSSRNKDQLQKEFDFGYEQKSDIFEYHLEIIEVKDEI